jgi:putative membrane protein
VWTAALVAALHYLALAIGLPAVFLRGRALAAPPDAPGLRRLFAADAAWGLAAALWVATGLWRAFGGLEKGSAFYLHSPLFLLKMALFAAVVALEIWPMTVLAGWRRAHRRGQAVDTRRARALFHVNHAQLAIVVLMVFVASAMARGLW